MPFKNLDERREYFRKYYAAHREERLESSCRWSASHPERVREHGRKYYAAHLEERQEHIRKWDAANPEKRRGYSRRWRAANPESVKEQSRMRNLRKYNLTEAQFDGLLVAQGGACLICGLHPAGKKSEAVLHIDHDHTTGVVRGLLCGRCNKMLGNAKDTPSILRAAADYLERKETE